MEGEGEQGGALILSSSHFLKELALTEFSFSENA